MFAAPDGSLKRSLVTARRHGLRFAGLWVLAITVTACNQTQPVPPGAEVAIVGLEATTYVNDSITFEVAVVGGAYDSLELRRDGELFHVLAEPSFTWDVSAVPEASYTFVARVRRGADVFDSAPKVVMVDRTAPEVSLSAIQDQDPLLAGEGQVGLTATASDDVSLLRLELLDEEVVLASGGADLLELTLVPERGMHRYRARAVDRAGNQALTDITTVPVYVREAHTLVSEAALDGCISAGYEPGLFTRHFDVASCNWTTSWSTLHFFSFDRSTFPGALVESAELRFHRSDSFDPVAHLASVEYADTADAPPTAFIYPFVSTVPETPVTLDTSVGTTTQSLDVTAQVAADVTEGRQRSQLRLRTQSLGGGGLGGTGYFAEIGDQRVPRLALDLLVP